eukprot:gene9511-1718_t
MDFNFSLDFKEQGNQALKDGNIELALSYYSSGIEKSPDNHELYSNRSLIFFKLQNFEKSLKDAETAINLSPNWFKGYFRKANSLIELKRFCEASETVDLGAKKDKSIDKNNENITKLKQKISESVVKMLQQDFFIKEYYTLEELKFPFLSIKFLSEEIRITKDISKKLGFKVEHFEQLFILLRSINLKRKQKIILQILLKFELTSDHFLELLLMFKSPEPIDLLNFDKICEGNFEKFYIPAEMVVVNSKAPTSIRIFILKIFSKILDKKNDRFFSKVKKIFLELIKDDNNLMSGEMTKILIEGLGRGKVKDAIPVLRDKFESEKLFNYDNWETILEIFNVKIPKDDYLVRNCQKCHKTLLKCQKYHSNQMLEISEKSNKHAVEFYQKNEFKRCLQELNVSYTLGKCDLTLMVNCLLKLNRHKEAFYIAEKEEILEKNLDLLCEISTNSVGFFDEFIESNESAPVKLDFSSITYSSINWSVHDEHGVISTLSHKNFVYEDYEEDKIYVLNFKNKPFLEISSPNVLQLKLNKQELLTYNVDHSMSIIDLDKKEKVFTMKSDCLCKEVKSIAYDSDKIIFGYSTGKNVVSFDRKTKKEKCYFGIQGSIQSIVFDKKSLFVAGFTDLREFDIETEELIATYVSFNQKGLSSPQCLLLDENLLICAYESNMIGVWSRTTHKLLRYFDIVNEISSIDLSSSYLVVGTHGQPGLIYIFDCLSGEQIYELDHHENCILGVQWKISNASAILTTASVDGTCRKFKIPIKEDQRFKRCSHCNKLLIEISTKYCGRCLNRIYCSKECQNLDWPTHKVHCKPVVKK